MRVISSISQRWFSQSAWRGWLETLQQMDEAMELTEIDFLEKRLSNLEAQVLEMQERGVQLAAESVLPGSAAGVLQQEGRQ